MGENGAGKSTLVRHFNGLLKPCAAPSACLASDVAALSVAEAARSLRAPRPEPGDYFVRDTVAAEIDHTLDDLEARRRARAASSRRGSSPSSTSPSFSSATRADLSGGERTRVALAAVACGDPRARRARRTDARHGPARTRPSSSTLRRWVAAGRCVLVVTHDVEFAARCADARGRAGRRRRPRRRPRRRGPATARCSSRPRSTGCCATRLPGVLHEDEVAWEVSPSVTTASSPSTPRRRRARRSRRRWPRSLAVWAAPDPGAVDWGTVSFGTVLALVGHRRRRLRRARDGGARSSRSSPPWPPSPPRAACSSPRCRTSSR